ncbi:MAG: redox-sensing transcriptional repressor Rex [Clostridia bacterium]|nr:redox-sensing transcriptional repressor Rex [Clostridia bacterium]
MKNSGNNQFATGAGRNNRATPSDSVIKRLPRYFRYLRILMRNGISRISSNELSKMMNVTASQIRQDLNCFGGFGQQGYGYNVEYLYAKICDLLGVGAGLCSVIIGAGNLGRAIVRSNMFDKRGVEIIGMFDINPVLVNQKIEHVDVYAMESLDEFCRNNRVDFAVLTLPKESAQEVASRLMGRGVQGVWNFTGQELELGEGAIVENVHLGDSLMTLCYRVYADQSEN